MSKNNQQYYQNVISKQKQRFALRKWSIGVVSVLVGTTLFFGEGAAQADETLNGQNDSNLQVSKVSINQALSDEGPNIAQTSTSQQTISSQSSNEAPTQQQAAPVLKQSTQTGSETDSLEATSSTSATTIKKENDWQPTIVNLSVNENQPTAQLTVNYADEATHSLVGQTIVNGNLGYSQVHDQKDFIRVCTFNFPDGTKKQLYQNAEITRFGKKDNDTGVTTWGQWTSAEFPALEVPRFAGYTASATIPAEKLTPNSKAAEHITINYTPDQVKTKRPAMDPLAMRINQAARSMIGDFTYSQVRPIQVAINGDDDSIKSISDVKKDGLVDCSGFVWLAMKLAGANVAKAATGPWYTGSMAEDITGAQQYLKQLDDPSQIQPGDVIVMNEKDGRGNNGHTAIIDGYGVDYGLTSESTTNEVATSELPVIQMGGGSKNANRSTVKNAFQALAVKPATQVLVASPANLVNAKGQTLPNDDAGKIIQMVKNYGVIPSTNKVVNVLNYGAKGDSKTDNLQAIQKALDDVKNAGGGIVYIPAGNYMINALTNNPKYSGSESVNIPVESKGLQVGSNTTVLLDKEATLSVIPNNHWDYLLMDVHKADNVNILGGTLAGDRWTHDMSTPNMTWNTSKGFNSPYYGEWGTGISTDTSKNVLIKGVNLKNFWGDGIAAFPNAADANKGTQSQAHNLHVTECNFNNNRRQGISLGHVDNVEVDHCLFANTDGTGPAAGIDLEPGGGTTEQVTNAKIHNNVFLNNNNAGLTGYAAPKSKVSNLHIYNNSFINNGAWMPGNLTLNNVQNSEIDHNEFISSSGSRFHAIWLMNTEGNNVHDNYGRNSMIRIAKEAHGQGSIKHNFVSMVMAENTGYDISDNHLPTEISADELRKIGAGLDYQKNVDNTGLVTNEKVVFKGFIGGTKLLNVTSNPDDTKLNQGDPISWTADISFDIDGSLLAHQGDSDNTIRFSKPLITLLHTPDTTPVIGSSDLLSDTKGVPLMINGFNCGTVYMDYIVPNGVGKFLGSGIKHVTLHNIHFGDSYSGKNGQGEKTVITTADGQKYGYTYLNKDGSVPKVDPASLDASKLEIQHSSSSDKPSTQPSTPTTHPSNPSQPSQPSDAAKNNIIKEAKAHGITPNTNAVINITDLGAKQNQVDNDAFQKAFDQISKAGGGIVYVPAGHWIINGTVPNQGDTTFYVESDGLKIPSNTTLLLDKNAVVETQGNSKFSSTQFKVDNVENVNVIGGHFVGDRLTHKIGQTTNFQGNPKYAGEAGFGLVLAGAKNVNIKDTSFKDFWGDGVNVFFDQKNPAVNQNVLIDNVDFDDNRRQGVSVENVDGLHITNSHISNTGRVINVNGVAQSGTSPKAGIDLEPSDGNFDPKLKQVKNVEIDHNTFDNQVGAAILTSAMRNNQTPLVIDHIKIHDNTFNDNGSEINGQVHVCGANDVNVNNNTFNNKSGKIPHAIWTGWSTNVNITNNKANKGDIVVEPLDGQTYWAKQQVTGSITGNTASKITVPKDWANTVKVANNNIGDTPVKPGSDSGSQKPSSSQGTPTSGSQAKPGSSTAGSDKPSSSAQPGNKPGSGSTGSTGSLSSNKPATSDGNTPGSHTSANPGTTPGSGSQKPAHSQSGADSGTQAQPGNKPSSSHSGSGVPSHSTSTPNKPTDSQSGATSGNQAQPGNPTKPSSTSSTSSSSTSKPGSSTNSTSNAQPSSDSNSNPTSQTSADPGATSGSSSNLPTDSKSNTNSESRVRPGLSSGNTSTPSSALAEQSDHNDSSNSHPVNSQADISSGKQTQSEEADVNNDSNPVQNTNREKPVNQHSEVSDELSNNQAKFDSNSESESNGKASGNHSSLSVINDEVNSVGNNLYHSTNEQTPSFNTDKLVLALTNINRDANILASTQPSSTSPLVPVTQQQLPQTGNAKNDLAVLGLAATTVAWTLSYAALGVRKKQN